MRMRKWSGGTLIAFLALLLFLSYTLLDSTPQKHHSTAPTTTTTTRRDPSSKKKKKPHLLRNLEGLHYLFPSPPANTSSQPTSKKPIVTPSKEKKHTSLSEQDSFNGARLVWEDMRALLARSDALPDTAAGVREAAAAWKKLMAGVEIEKTTNNSREYENCPFSVSSQGNGTMGALEIPCGFVQGSAVTVVGVPHVGSDGNGTSFQIELVGSRLPGEKEPPVVLRYSVRLGGDAMIAQNTWKQKQGWGVEEWCPDPALRRSDLRVDGLVRCNEQLGGSVTSENNNGSQVDGNKPPIERSGGSSDLSMSFPFVEGHPFTATLWAGMEGFHMTVNGKHETSFPYRETLEPWLVSGVRVAGDMDVLSSLANRLPVSEEIESVVDIQNLRAPSLPKKRIFLLVGVFSSGNNFERRMALRRTWMQYEAVRSGDVAIRFFTGLHKNKQVNLELWKEAQTYGDIQMMPFVDYYSLITLKTVAICILGTKFLPAKYIMKTDDDAFVRIDEVLSILKKSGSSGLLYGLISFESEPHRDKESKWYISTKEWPHESYPPWAHGPGYIISRDIAKFVVWGHQEGDLQLFKLEDVAMGIWIEEFKKTGQEVHYVNDDQFHSAGCEGGYILAHYQGPRLMLCLWEKLQREHEPICCE